MASTKRVVVRPASHAGSWYSANRGQLSNEIDGWLREASSRDHNEHMPRGFICPHAGYRYSGLPAAHAYRSLEAAVTVNSSPNIFVLGPSHHAPFHGCRLTQYESLETPLGSLPVNRQIVSELAESRMMSYLDSFVDDEEHSLEMQFPFIARKAPSAKVIPIMVGSISEDEEAQFGALLSRYVENPQNLFVISSDFCHWGRRFGYTFYDESWGGKGQIWKSIEHLDRLAMDHIESCDSGAFSDYLRTYSNTICGRRAISIMIHALNRASGAHLRPKFVHYAQSSQVTTTNDSSVSYAVANIINTD
ncbi:protein MEMO1 [Pelomyxa schiedti]|nr:protein MEMO1 [Pelomyxa schiedti]